MREGTGGGTDLTSRHFECDESESFRRHQSGAAVSLPRFSRVPVGSSQHTTISLYTKHEEPSKCVHKRSQATENVIHESHTRKLIKKDEEEN